ncbi:hypothetical protein FGO68_gene3005 [Halteria grandinella]|uniref:Uncharacterized protein n=1 Tax=Halteria grandinella TaxID=5974 RepID=A0A8J8NUE6_HALGN|nr:hypothetical protein FGO68_gene3005 [Halteria grandinella]
MSNRYYLRLIFLHNLSAQPIREESKPNHAYKHYQKVQYTRRWSHVIFSLLCITILSWNQTKDPIQPNESCGSSDYLQRRLSRGNQQPVHSFINKTVNPVLILLFSRQINVYSKIPQFSLTCDDLILISQANILSLPLNFRQCKLNQSLEFSASIGLSKTKYFSESVVIEKTLTQKETRSFLAILSNPEFYEELNLKQDLSSTEFFTITMSPIITVVQQQAYTLPQLLSDLGGMANLLTACGLFVLSLFHDQLLQAALIGELYQFDREETTTSGVKIKSKSEIAISCPSTKKECLFTEKDARWLLDFEPQLFFQELSRRAHLVFSCKDILRQKCRKRDQKVILWEKAQQKLSMDFDVTNVIRVMRQCEVLNGVLMNKQQRQMIELQRANVIQQDEQFHRDDEGLRQAKLRENCLYGSLADLRKRIDYFKQKPKLNMLDKRLLLGIFKGQVELTDSIQQESPNRGKEQLQALEKIVLSARLSISPQFKECFSHRLSKRAQHYQRKLNSPNPNYSTPPKKSQSPRLSRNSSSMQKRSPNVPSSAKAGVFSLRLKPTISPVKFNADFLDA